MTFRDKHPFFLPMFSLAFALFSLGLSVYSIGRHHGAEDCIAEETR